MKNIRKIGHKKKNHQFLASLNIRVHNGQSSSCLVLFGFHITLCRSWFQLKEVNKSISRYQNNIFFAGTLSPFSWFAFWKKEGKKRGVSWKKSLTSDEFELAQHSARKTSHFLWWWDVTEFLLLEITAPANNVINQWKHWRGDDVASHSWWTSPRVMQNEHHSFSLFLNFSFSSFAYQEERKTFRNFNSTRTCIIPFQLRVCMILT